MFGFDSTKITKIVVKKHYKNINIKNLISDHKKLFNPQHQKAHTIK